MDKSLMINKIKEHYNFKVDADFARFLGIKPQVLSNWKSRNSFDSKLLYTKCVGINPVWLLTGEGEMFLNQSSDNINEANVINEKTPAIYAKKDIAVPAVVTVDKEGKDNVVLVPVKAAAGYLKGYDDPRFVEKLPTYSLPNIKNGTFRMFQVAGHSMHPTLMDKSYVVGEWVENWVKDIKDNRVYVVVCSDGVLVKRALNRLKKYGNLYLKSDNRQEHPNLSVEIEQIREVWEVKMHIGLELPDPSLLYDRVNDLEANVMFLMDKIGK